MRTSGFDPPDAGARKDTSALLSRFYARSRAPSRVEIASIAVTSNLDDRKTTLAGVRDFIVSGTHADHLLQ